MRRLLTHLLAFLAGAALVCALWFGWYASHDYERRSVVGHAVQAGQQVDPLLRDGWQIERIEKARTGEIEYLTYFLRRSKWR